MYKLETDPQDIQKPQEKPAKRNVPVLGFIITSLLVLCSLYTCSWFSILDPFIVPLIDTRSKIRVDYGPWEVSNVQQVDLSIIKEVEEDRGDGIDLETLTELEKKGWFWEIPESTQADQPTATVQVLPTNTTNPTETTTETLATPTETTHTTTPTLIPTDTLNPTQTNTIVPSVTPTVIVLTSTPTTGTATSTPETVDPLCSLISFGDIEVNGSSKDVRFTITNNTGALITITQIDLSWPYVDNGNLIEIKLKNKKIYDIEIGPSPVSITTWKEGTGIRKIGDGNFQTIIFIFEVFAGSSGYTFEITFDNGCTISNP